MNEKRVVVVTGAAGGIGFAIAEKFASVGDQPIIVDINEEQAALASEKLAAQYGCKALTYAVDVADQQAIQHLVQKVVEQNKCIDIIVNNAGLQFISPVEDFPVEKWDLLLGVMLKGPFLLMKYAIPHMRRRKFGRIINISSVHGKTASPYKSAYISAKHGLVGLTRAAALEVANDNITVNAVMPGTVQTPLVEKQLIKLAHDDGISEEEALQKHMLARQALKRFITPEEVAACCYFLASKEAGAITGETVSVSGGW